MKQSEIDDLARFKPLDSFKKEWIEEKIDEKGIQYLENLGFFLCDRIGYNRERNAYYLEKFPRRNAITSSQIRNIFGEIKRIEMKVGNNKEIWEQEKYAFLLLRPKIAYNTARVVGKNSKSFMQDLKEVLEIAHRHVITLEQFKNFSNFFEGIIAYHKSYGGKDK